MDSGLRVEFSSIFLPLRFHECAGLFQPRLSDAVALPDTCSRVHHLKRTVLARAELDPLRGAFIEVRDLFIGEISFTCTTLDR
jgi:hypothetical protein